jgi:hypothetical protein
MPSEGAKQSVVPKGPTPYVRVKSRIDHFDTSGEDHTNDR